MHGLRDHQNSADLGPTAWPSPPKRTPRDPRAPTHTQKLAPALLPSLSWATLTWNPPLGQLAWPETSRPLVLKSSDCPCLTSTPETYPQAGLASPSAVQGEQQQRRWGKGDRHIAPRGRGACTGHTGRGPAPVPRPPTVAGAGGRASRAARGHAILSVGSWRPSWPSPRSPGSQPRPGQRPAPSPSALPGLAQPDGASGDAQSWGLLGLGNCGFRQSLLLGRRVTTSTLGASGAAPVGPLPSSLHT